MSFLKKLKEADDEMKSSIVNITPQKSESKGLSSSAYKGDKQTLMSPSLDNMPEIRPTNVLMRKFDDPIVDIVKNHTNDKFNHDEYDNIDRDSILWKVSEYLFDLFDANCLDGYKRIEAFEDRVMKHFADDAEEYTFEQERCHREFLDLFESLIEDFLKENKCTTQIFYAEVNKEIKKKGKNINSSSEANEILDVIFCYCDFKSWVSYMREQAKRRFNNKTLMQRTVENNVKYVSSDAKHDNDNNTNSILWKVSEYLFNLFDANCLDGYKRIEAFEDRVMKHFADDAEEYTFEQERCHREFLDLFESLIEDFLKENKCTTQIFYAEVNKEIKKKGMKDDDEANEVLEVICCYCDFLSWTQYMREQAQKRYRPKTLMEIVIEKHDGKQTIVDSKHDETNDNIDRDSILWKVSEYLFDLFDANCLDGYKRIEAFEDRVMKHFADDAEEYTFEQERCHREFLDLFESLIEDFLKENKCTTQIFYAEVNLVVKKKAAHNNKEANEILDVIFCYCDFKSWVSYMREQAKNRFTIMQQISMNKAASKTHRFEYELK